METTRAEHPSEAVSFLEDLETNVVEFDSELVCHFDPPKDEESLSVWRRFVQMLSVTKKLKHLIISEHLISDKLGKALAENYSLKTIKIREYYMENTNFLACLERNTSLVDISFENCIFETEAIEFILGSSVLRVRLVSIGIVRLNTNKQMFTPFYKFSRLTELYIGYSFGAQLYAVLRILCFCEQLKKLDISYLRLSDLFLAFPKWTNELKNVLPLINSLLLESPFTSLMHGMLTSNVSNDIMIPHKVSSGDTNDLRRLLAAAERKERGTKMHVDYHQRGSFIGGTILFAARLRSKDPYWKDTQGNSEIWV